MVSFHISRLLFCRGVGLSFVFAFASLYVQWPGLFGHDGIAPVQETDAHWLLWVPRSISFIPHWPLDVWADLTMIVGWLCSASSVCGWCNRISLGIAWCCYFSLFTVGQPFLSFQWDILLLEAGVIAFLWAPSFGGWSSAFHWLAQTKSSSLIAWFWAPLDSSCSWCDSSASPVVMWLARFTLFKLMFMSGAVKIQASCPTWLGLTALDYHYATQCLPTPLAWYAHQFPPLLQQLSVAGCLLIELPIAVWCLLPFRSTRLLGAFAQVFLQLSIILTGNYTFFNFLTIVLCIPLIDDACFLSLFSCRAVTSPASCPNTDVIHAIVEQCAKVRGLTSIVFALVLGATVYCTYEMFAVTTFPAASFLWDRYRLRFAPSVHIFNQLLEQQLPPLLFMFALVFGVVAIATVMRGVLAVIVRCRKDSLKDWVYAFWKISEIVVVIACACVVFGASVCTFTSLSHSLASQLPRVAKEAHSLVAPYSVTSGYGLFRRMTGVGEADTHARDEFGRPYSVVARPEVVLLGHSGVKGEEWHEIEFLHKPGRADRAPSWVAPHQPRLDWQMWFAALSPQPPGWFIHLVDKLLEGSPAVIALLDPSYPFPHQPPKRIRAMKYNYEFTHANTTWNRRFAKAYSARDWWVRSGGTEYLPPIEKGNSQVTQFLKRQGWSRTQRDLDLCDKFSHTKFLGTFNICHGVRHLRDLMSNFSQWMRLSCAAIVLRLSGSMLFAWLG